MIRLCSVREKGVREIKEARDEQTVFIRIVFFLFSTVTDFTIHKNDNPSLTNKLNLPNFIIHVMFLIPKRLNIIIIIYCPTVQDQLQDRLNV